MNKIQLLISILFIFVNATMAQIAPDKVNTIVIDPGHGGYDPGAIGKFSKEKDVVLKISKKFGELIKKNFPEVNIIYTRNGDEAVELYLRSKMANEKSADLFISVHANSFSNNGPYGLETFFMGTSMTALNMEVAKKENSVILNEKQYKNNYYGFDPNDPETYIIMSLSQNINIKQSSILCNIIQKNGVNNLGRFDRGVKQAGFWVLWKTTMPSILVELGFISNPDEEKYMNSEIGQENLSRMLYNSFVEYKSQYEEIQYNKKIDYINEDITEIYQDSSSQKIDKIIASDSSKHAQNNVNSQEGNKTVNDNTTVVNNNNNKVNTPTNNTNNKNGIKDSESITYKVQIVSSKTKIDLKPENFKGYKNVEESFYKKAGLYIYTIGSEKTIESAKKLCDSAKKDFPTSWVVIFKNGERQ